MSTTIKTVVFWAVIAISALLLVQTVRSPQARQQPPEITYSQFITEVEAGEVARVDIAGSRIQGQYRNGKGTFWLVGPGNPGVFLDTLRNRGVEIKFKDAAGDAQPLHLLGTLAPLILLAALWFFMIRQMQRKRETLQAGGRPEPPGNIG